MTNLERLTELGQSVWLDYIRRSYTRSGELRALVAKGVRGVTSNPTIFENAIAGSADYDDELKELAERNCGIEETYESLAITDIQEASEVLRPIYDESNGDDGYVSMEVDPTLARDTVGTVAAAKRLFTAIGRPNIMIKIPATPEGIPAIRQVIASGINVNVTLIFSLSNYDQVVEAYLSGLEALAETGGNLDTVASVASFFISRVDSAVDEAVEAVVNDGDVSAAEIAGHIAVDNARVAYVRFQELFAGRRWEKLQALGARVQRPLWASTGTKKPSYPDTMYVDGLIGPDTVNTVPPATLDAFMDHGSPARTIDHDIAGARDRMRQLAKTGIDLDQITGKLQEVGVQKFAESFTSLKQSISGKRQKMLS